MGYFPTYSLGAMYACQIYETALLELPTLEADIAQGKFSPLKTWLAEKVHSSGRYDTIQETEHTQRARGSVHMNDHLHMHTAAHTLICSRCSNLPHPTFSFSSSSPPSPQLSRERRCLDGGCHGQGSRSAGVPQIPHQEVQRYLQTVDETCWFGRLCNRLCRVGDIY